MIHSDPMSQSKKQVPLAVAFIAQVFLCWGLLFEQRYLHLGVESDGSCCLWLPRCSSSQYQTCSGDVRQRRHVFFRVFSTYFLFCCGLVTHSVPQWSVFCQRGIPKLVQTNKPPEASHSQILSGQNLRNRLTSRVFTDISIETLQWFLMFLVTDLRFTTLNCRVSEVVATVRTGKTSPSIGPKWTGPKSFKTMAGAPRALAILTGKGLWRCS